MATMFGGSGMWDTGSFHTRWFTESGCVAAIVRPDSYVYGLGRGAGELSALAKDPLSALGRP